MDVQKEDVYVIPINMAFINSPSCTSVDNDIASLASQSKASTQIQVKQSLSNLSDYSF